MSDKLKCPSCGTINEIDNCSDCGNSLFLLNRKKSASSQLLVLIGILIVAGVTLYWFLLDLLFIALDSYELYDSIKYMDEFMSLILAGTPILFALSLRKKKYRVIGLVFGIMVALIRIYWIVKGLIPVEEFEYFEF